MNNLFITGNIRIGKSSLIRKCLVPYQDVLGGIELTVPVFRTNLYELLRSEISCIGVIKSFKGF